VHELVPSGMLIGKERMQQEIWFQKYKILGLLGRGGTARVFLAEHIKLNSYRAIKCISKNHPLYELQRNEAFILKNLKHSCIPIIYDIEEDEEGSYIVEQYLEGDTLKDYVSLNGALREDIIIHFGLQLCDLIQYLHSVDRPVLYIDLKPENIIVDGTTLKLIDFGSAVYRDRHEAYQEYTGTKGYAAPELYRQASIDERCDVYGIGMLLYYMAVGLTVKDGRSSVDNIDLAGHCGKKLKNIINRCLRYNPSQRYASVAKLSKQLSAFVRKDQFPYGLEKTIKIGIAGAQPRIGVTHFAFRLCSYFKFLRFKHLYQEMNGSGCVRSIKNRYEDAVTSQGIFEMDGIAMLAFRQGIREEPEGYQVIIRDFGCLTKDNLGDFLKAEVKLLILGAKDWELENSENILNMVAEYKDISYLFNFMNGRQFQQAMKSMNHKNSYRIPYEPDPFAEITLKNGLELFRELALPVKKRTWFKRMADIVGGRK
jgi:hypothetical protein